MGQILAGWNTASFGYKFLSQLQHLGVALKLESTRRKYSRPGFAGYQRKVEKAACLLPANSSIYSSVQVAGKIFSFNLSGSQSM